ncbi:MAG: hypothetical protein LBQ19_00490 [Synergistaceae bacterium]|jgi:hypothetical protein|nr:hypothetical protein [Synergistaceae bacterium]
MTERESATGATASAGKALKRALLLGAAASLAALALSCGPAESAGAAWNPADELAPGLALGSTEAELEEFFGFDIVLFPFAPGPNGYEEGTDDAGAYFEAERFGKDGVMGLAFRKGRLAGFGFEFLAGEGNGFGSEEEALEWADRAIAGMDAAYGEAEARMQTAEFSRLSGWHSDGNTVVITCRELSVGEFAGRMKGDPDSPGIYEAVPDAPGLYVNVTIAGGELL